MKQQPTPAPELIAAANAVFQARATVQTLRPIIKKIQTDVLVEIGAKDEIGAPITSPDSAWSICEQQATTFYTALDVAYAAAGFSIPSGYCPLLMAENLEREAVRELLKTADTFWKAGGADLTYDRLRSNPTIYKEVTETTLKFLAQFIK